jgi:hypothetical protein
MKQKLFSLLLLASLVVSVACSDDEGGPKSSFTIGDKKYTLTDGEYYISNDDDWTGYYITLSGMTSKEYRSVDFSIWVQNGDGIPVGTFDVDDNYIYFEIVVVDLESGDDIKHLEGADSGEVIISKSGDTYTITFDVVVDGEPVTGTYKGKIESSNNDN